jgi:UDP-glucose 4-epimerase
MAVLVTGGAGYIGSHMAYALQDRGEQVVVLDNLSTGQRKLIPAGAVFVEGSVGDAALVSRILRENDIEAVGHFAGSIVVPESVVDPLGYYGNNTVNASVLIRECVGAGVRNFIFSSTAAVYGTPNTPRVPEAAPTAPINPYGRSKLMTEWMLEDASRAHSISYVALRYFNVCGADPQGRTGQSTPRATHLIKRACQAAQGHISHLDIFGTDFDTPDGTGVRDYIHVSDLVDVHLLALDSLRAGGPSAVYNVGYGVGFSVREVIAAVERVAGRAIPVKEGPRRAGDPALLIADPGLVRSALDWHPKYCDLMTIVRSAYAWEQTQHDPAQTSI